MLQKRTIPTLTTVQINNTAVLINRDQAMALFL